MANCRTVQTTSGAKYFWDGVAGSGTQSAGGNSCDNARANFCNSYGHPGDGGTCFPSTSSTPTPSGSSAPSPSPPTISSITSKFSTPGCGLNIPVIGGIPCFGIIGLGVALIFMLFLLTGKR